MEFISQTYNLKAKYANQKPNLELNFVIKGQRFLVQVSMGTGNFVIFLSLADYSPSLFPAFPREFTIIFKHTEYIGKFLWKIQQKIHGTPFWGATGKLLWQKILLFILTCLFQAIFLN